MEWNIVDGRVCDPDKVNIPYIYMLFYEKINPNDFLATVKYTNSGVVFQKGYAFGWTKMNIGRGEVGTMIKSTRAAVMTVLMLLLFVLPVTSIYAEGNLLQNPGFEEGEMMRLLTGLRICGFQEIIQAYFQSNRRKFIPAARRQSLRISSPIIRNGCRRLRLRRIVIIKSLDGSK